MADEKSTVWNTLGYDTNTDFPDQFEDRLHSQQIIQTGFSNMNAIEVANLNSKQRMECEEKVLYLS